MVDRYTRELISLINTEKISVNKLAAVANIPSSTVYGIVRGTTKKPSLELILKLFDAIGCDVEIKVNLTRKVSKDLIMPNSVKGFAEKVHRNLKKEERIAKGLCVRCGRSVENTGLQQCEICRMITNSNAQLRYRKRKKKS